MVGFAQVGVLHKWGYCISEGIPSYCIGGGYCTGVGIAGGGGGGYCIGEGIPSYCIGGGYCTGEDTTQLGLLHK